MIKDLLENYKCYESISENLKTGFEWIKNNDLENISDGHYEIRNGIYANVQTYKTKEDADYEAHRKFIDIQYMISGDEKCGIVNYGKCVSCIEYDQEKDIEFLKSKIDEYYTLSQGEFLVLFPQDAHKPSINNNTEKTVKKVVVKVPV